MGEQKTRKRAIERETLITHDGTTITVAHFHVSGQEKGIILIPPLIGGSFILFGRQFSYLVKQGYRIVSFNYRGHDLSQGRFTLASMFSDTLDIALRLKNSQPDTPLFAVGTCSGSMPLFHIVNRIPHLIQGLVFVNAIYDLQQTATPWESMKIYVRSRGLSIPHSAGEIASVVLDEVFPEIDKGPDHFGILTYDRVNLTRISFEYVLKLGPRMNFTCPIPTLCMYGKGDEMLGMDDPNTEIKYREEFEKRFPNIMFSTFEADHFMTGLKTQVAQTMHLFVAPLSASA